VATLANICRSIDVGTFPKTREMFYETENLPAEYEHIPTPEKKKSSGKTSEF
jgi:hypothetical protein